MGALTWKTGLAALCLGMTAGIARSATYYIAANGNDLADGQNVTSAWQTLDRVNTSQANGDTFLFRRGDTFRGQIDVLYNDTTWGAYGTGDYPVIAGSTLVTNWSLHTGSLYRASVAGVTNGIHHLFINGQIATIARYPNPDAPNDGWLQTAAGTAHNILQDPELALLGLTNGYFNGATARVRSFSWLFNDRTVLGFNSGTGALTLDQPVDEHPGSVMQPGWGFYLDGLLKLLDQEGEWFYDPVSETVYLWAPGGVDPDTLTIEGMTYDFGITMFWQKYRTTVQDLKFKHQADAGVRVWVCHDTTVRSNAFEYCQRFGVRLPWDSTNFVVEANTFDNMLNFAIFVAENDSFDNGDCYIRDNVIRNTAMIPGYGVDGVAQCMGIRIDGSDINILRNTIDYTGYAGIFIVGNRNLVEENIVRHAEMVLDDGGGIFLVDGYGHIVRRNIVMDTFGERGPSSGFYNGYFFRQLGMGIFTQPYLTNFLIEGNTIANNVDWGIYLDHASDVIVRSNTCYNNREHLHFSGTGTGNHVADNIFYGLNASQVCVSVNGAVNPGTFNSNLYGNPYNGLVISEDNSSSNIPYYSLASWQNTFPTRDQQSRTGFESFREYSVLSAGTNLVTNSTFDIGIQGWRIFNAAGSHDPAHPEMDGGSLLVQDTDPAQTSTEIGWYALEQDQSYELTFDAAADSLGSMELIVSESTNPVAQFLAVNTNRQAYQWAFTWPYASTTALLRIHTTDQDPYSLWLDNVVFRSADVAPNQKMIYSRLFTNMSPQQAAIPFQNLTYRDLEGNYHAGSLSLEPYASAILTLANDPQVTAANVAPSTQTIRWVSEDGKTYSVDTSTNLSDYVPAQEGITATPPENSFTNTYPEAVRYFRIRSGL